MLPYKSGTVLFSDSFSDGLSVLADLPGHYPALSPFAEAPSGFPENPVLHIIFIPSPDLSHTIPAPLIDLHKD